MKHSFFARFRQNQTGTFRKSVRDEYGIAVPWRFGCCRIPQNALDQGKILPQNENIWTLGGKAWWSLHHFSCPEVQRTTSESRLPCL